VIRLLHLEMGFVSVRDVVAWSGGCSQGSWSIPKGLQRGFDSLFLLVGCGCYGTFGRQNSTSRQLLHKIIEEANILGACKAHSGSVRLSYKSYFSNS
jgi:hypothetical protein